MFQGQQQTSPQSPQQPQSSHSNSSEPPVDMKNLGANLPSKTPVSLLQELCMRRNITPKYDLLQIEGAVHEPTFVFRVTVGEFTANGSGQSKKKAKHAAAKAVLDIIIHGSGPHVPSTLNGDSAPVSSTKAPSDLSTMVVSPYDDGIPGNPVGQLQELCMTRRWPPPTYELSSEEGFPHERTFTIACTIATHREMGGGKSKKLAKRQAAFKMLKKLADLPQDQSSAAGMGDDDEELTHKIAMRYSGIKETKLSLCDTRTNQYHKQLKKQPGAKLKELQKTSLATKSINFLDLLAEICTEANITPTYVEVEEKAHSGACQCLLQLSTMPVAVVYGTGASAAEAQSDSAHNALEYLKVMTKR